MAWLEARQRVLAAEHRQCRHARLPAARPAPLRQRAGRRAGGGGAHGATNPRHLASASDPLLARPDRTAADRSPNGNAVSLDREALKVAETDSAHALATGLHRRYLGLFRTALGRSQ